MSVLAASQLSYMKLDFGPTRCKPLAGAVLVSYYLFLLETCPNDFT